MNELPEPPNGQARGLWIESALRRFEPQLLRYARSLLHRSDLAGEVVQDTFLQLCRLPPSASGFSPGAWLFRVCRNRAIDVLRKEKRMLTDSMEFLDAASGDSADPARIAEENETAGRIGRILEGLTANQQEVVRLKFQNGFSYREISEVTGLSVSSVGVQLHEALQKIRRRMVTTGQPQQSHSESPLKSRELP